MSSNEPCLDGSGQDSIDPITESHTSVTEANNIIISIDDDKVLNDKEIKNLSNDCLSISLNALDLAQNCKEDNNNRIGQSTTSINSVESLKNEYNEQEITRLKELIKQKEADYANLETKMNEVETQSRAQIEELHLTLNSKLEQALKKIQESQKDKTSMVMKYVEAERKCIELNKTIEISQSKLNDSLKDKLRLNEKLEKSRVEIEKANQENDKKLKELMSQRREIEKLKEQIVLSDAREKAAQLKFKTEHELCLGLKSQLDQANQELNELKKRISSLNLNTSTENLETVENISGDNEQVNNESLNNENETSPIVINEQQLSPQPPAQPQASPEQIKKNQLVIDKTQIDTEKERLKRELSALKSQLKDMFEERTTLRDRVKCLEQERSLQEVSLGKYKETLQSQKQLNKELLNENLQLREHQETWTKEELEKKEVEQKLKLYQSELSDLQIEMNEKQEKQNELLLFTSKLTEKNTQLQSENTNLNEKLESIKLELDKSNIELKESNETFKKEIERLKNELAEQTKQNEQLSNELKEKTKQVEELSTKLSDEQDENSSLKKKHAANIKDLSRQLQTLQKKLNQQQLQQQTPTTLSTSIQESYELTHTPSSSMSLKNSLSYNSHLNQSDSHNKQSQSTQNSSNSFHKGSRTSSASSLIENNHYSLMDNHDDVKSIDSSNMSTTNSNTTPLSYHQNSYNNEVLCGAPDDVYIVDIDKQKIIDKIVKLQKTLAKRNEKIDFLQEHVNQLTNDLKRKTKIIQAYAMNEDVGAFTSEAQDAIKREMSKKTGIMSALYNTNKSYMQTANFINSNESNMTMDLCLEINRKLQALLEDTLMKNLTLKESLETLGQEIAKLSKENRDLKLKT